MLLFMSDSFKVLESAKDSDIFKPHGRGEGVVEQKMDLDALAYTYSAMLHGGHGIGAPWALGEHGGSLSEIRRNWYKDHHSKVPSCPCLVHAEKQKLF